jgi:hypothetical protein
MNMQAMLQCAECTDVLQTVYLYPLQDVVLARQLA